MIIDTIKERFSRVSQALQKLKKAKASRSLRIDLHYRALKKNDIDGACFQYRHILISELAVLKASSTLKSEIKGLFLNNHEDHHE